MGKRGLTGIASMRVLSVFNQEGKREAKSGWSSEIMARDDEGLGKRSIPEALKHSYRKVVSEFFFSPASISNRSERQTGDPALLLKGHSSHWFAVCGGAHPITDEKLIMRFRNRPNKPRVVS